MYLEATKDLPYTNILGESSKLEGNSIIVISRKRGSIEKCSETMVFKHQAGFDHTMHHLPASFHGDTIQLLLPSETLVVTIIQHHTTSAANLTPS
jgi:hypothetical protein